MTINAVKDGGKWKLFFFVIDRTMNLHSYYGNMHRLSLKAIV